METTMAKKNTMFRDLYAVARHTPLHLIIAPNGEQLKIIVTPKPSGDAANNNALAKPFSAIGTPEELDREFPAALARYAGAVNELRTSLELPLDELEAAKKKASAKDEKKAARSSAQEEEEAKRRSEGAKKAAETRAQKAAGAKAEKERKAKERADAKAAKKANRPLQRRRHRP
jgi:PRTRC genetic system protein E